MKRILLFLLGALFLPLWMQAQKTAADVTVRVSAKVQKSPASITLRWAKDTTASSFVIYRKSPSSLSWGTSVGTVAGTARTWTDNNIVFGQQYEYLIVKKVSGSTSYQGYGYILSGIEIPAVEKRGKMILLVDKDLSTVLSTEINRLILDLTGDGWIVIRHDVAKTDPASDIHSLITSDYLADKANVKAVFVLGHVAVPYSGDSNIDGHSNHQGAWPADIYYGDMDGGDWTDQYINDVTSINPANYNIPGDGKFDQSTLTTDAELQVGRVDLYNMPAFGTDDTVLIRRYLNKDHLWKVKKLTAGKRALVEDDFGRIPYGSTYEFMSALALNSFSTMYGDSNVFQQNYLTTLRKDSFTWSYMAGGGTFTSVGGVNSLNYAADSLKSIFTLTFGSYFGDWDNRNNLLRAPLASRSPILINAWSGRPQWTFHYMSMGETAGFCQWQSANNYDNYFRTPVLNATQRLVTVGLMGDPSLRMDMIAPVTNLRLAHLESTKVRLTWTKSNEKALTGYNVYRASSLTSGWTKINSTPLTDTTTVDFNATNGTNYYMVRALALTTTASGTYYNLSIGNINSLSINTGIAQQQPHMLECSVFPNPTKGNFIVRIPANPMQQFEIRVYDLMGREVFVQAYTNPSDNIHIDLNGKPVGMYMVHISGEGFSATRRVVLE